MDAFMEIDTWKGAEHLFKSCSFAVIAREGKVFSGLTEAITKSLSEEFSNIDQHYNETEPVSGLKCIKVNTSSHLIIPIETIPVNVSSTKIRDNVKSGISVNRMVPEKVDIYIAKKKLYR